MIKQFLSNGNTAVYIDASNVFFAEKKVNFKIDFIKLYNFLKSETDAKIIKYYSPYRKSNKYQKKFLNILKETGYELILKEIKIIKSYLNKPIIKGNIDVELTIDAIEDMDKYKNFILFSGDSDFYPLLKKLSKHNKNIIIVSTKALLSTELSNIGKFIDIKHLKPYIALDEKEKYKNKFLNYYNNNEEILFFINFQ